ncbi:hypothetical protein ROHU_009886 [Labeo rohita]|uniref:Uncharacterized protein n=1 Tax=Labeo rohita TaxID=84645 RepID=A0A498M1U5_LABRO|nr:hypothetical protein ROHU_009886 [Labeo rohita]
MIQALDPCQHRYHRCFLQRGLWVTPVAGVLEHAWGWFLRGGRQGTRSLTDLAQAEFEEDLGNRGCLLGSEDEDGKNGELSRDAFICHTNPTAAWTHSFMKRGRKKRGTGEKDGRGEECAALLIKGCCRSVF